MTTTLAFSRSLHTATLLPDGRVLVAGGWDGTNPVPAADGGELFDKGLSFAPARRPVLATVALTSGPQLAVSVTGSGFTGDSEGSGGGGTSSSAVNVPLLHVQRLGNGDGTFLQVDPANPWSATAFASLPESKPHPAGHFLLTLFADGIPSISRVVRLAPQISATATSFPVVSLGQSSVPQPVVISNTGTNTLTLVSASVAGADFIPTPGGSCGVLPVTIPPGGSCTLDHTFAPTAVGVRSAAVTILSNDPDTPTTLVTLTGTGAPDGDLTGDGKVDIADALAALRMAVGLATPSAADIEHGDVAPLVAGLPSPNGVIDTGDALVILRKAVGLVTW